MCSTRCRRPTCHFPAAALSRAALAAMASGSTRRTTASGVTSISACAFACRRENLPMSYQKTSDPSRRRVIKNGLLAAMSAALPGSLLAADSQSLPIIQKAIPSTGQKLPVIGIGTNEFASTAYGSNSRGGTAYTTVRDVLKRMYELGGTVIDAASAYGDSEVQIGKAL